MQVFLSIAAVTYSQVEYEGTVNSIVKTTQFNDGVTRYYKLDSKQSQLVVYNLDNTIWKSIGLIVPENESVGKILLVSDRVFNNNNKLEIAYTTTWYELNSDNFEVAAAEIAQTHYTLFIIDEASSKILEVKGGYDFSVVENNGNKKLLVFKNAKAPESRDHGYTDIFSLNN